MGRYADGEVWGISNLSAPKVKRPSEIAFMCCPTFMNATTKYMTEPHGPFSPINYAPLPVLGGQADGNVAQLQYNRNYTFQDGHGVYWVKPGRNIAIP
jgi:hypothetical protein